MEGATTEAITVLLTGVIIVLVLRVVAVVPYIIGVEPVEPVLDKAEVTLVLVVSKPLVVFTIVFLVFPSLFVLFSVLPPVFSPFSLILPMGYGTLGNPKVGEPVVGGSVDGGCLGGIHRKILQSSHDLTTFPSFLQ